VRGRDLGLTGRISDLLGEADDGGARLLFQVEHVRAMGTVIHDIIVKSGVFTVYLNSEISIQREKENSLYKAYQERTTEHALGAWLEKAE